MQDRSYDAPQTRHPRCAELLTQQDPDGLYGVQEYSHQEKGRKWEEIIEIELLAWPRISKV